MDVLMKGSRMHRILLLAIAAGCAAQTLEQPSRAVTDPGVVTTRQAITPAGVPSVFQGRVYGVAWAGTTGNLWVLHASQVYLLDWNKNRVISRTAHGGVPGNQSIATDPASGEALVGVSIRDPQASASSAGVLVAKDSGLRSMARGLGRYQPGALAVAAENGAGGRRYAAVPLVWENKLAIVDVKTGEVMRQIDTGIAPFAAVIDRRGTTAWLSNLGGRPPKPGELFASPAQKPAERVVVDARGVASTGSLTRIDIESGKTATLPVGLHPTALALDEQRQRLYVANGNSESISVVDTERTQVLRTIPLQPFSQTVRGIAPTALQVSPDGATLFAACGGINAVAVIDTGTGKIRGLIPTGWYPNGVALDPSGRYLAISSLLGAGSGWRDAPSKRYVHANRGSVAVLPLPDAAQLASYTTAVAENNRLRLAGASPASERDTARNARPLPIPVRSGDPSTIQHVVFIIKENRTYDQVLGDMPKGNGDPSLVMFGEDVTPNQHRLADQFVLLDNFYATGGNSGDGHQWLTQANETEYCLWPGYQGRSYPFDGSDPMAYSSGGFIWNYAQARGLSVRVYGEYAGRMATPQRDRLSLLRKWQEGGDFSRDWSIKAPIESLNSILAAHYPSYSTAIPDVARAQIFLADLKRYESEGTLPHLILLQLPSNHTSGTAPGGSTPKAMVADNDFALGQIVEALSRSRFWPKMAIFVVEDDAQNGVDHVDGHRTTAFVASPYARRGHIDSTFYSHQSMLKTIELILGLPTMSIFDLIAHDMRNSFTGEPDLTTYTAVRPKQDLMEINPPANALAGAARKAALDSARMKWNTPDAAPTERLNRIVWGAVKGWNVPYPATRRSVFSPLEVETDDDDR
jgi:YVTN family beta-propeller protein